MPKTPRKTQKDTKGRQRLRPPKSDQGDTTMRFDVIDLRVQILQHVRAYLEARSENSEQQAQRIGFWHSEEGKDLLSQAYPLGFLDISGLQTLSGHVVRESESRPGHFYWLRLPKGSVSAELPLNQLASKTPFPQKRQGRSWVDQLRASEKRWLYHHSCGDFLPLPNPQDSATWACLLKHLAGTFGFSANSTDQVTLRKDSSNCWDLVIQSLTEPTSQVYTFSTEADQPDRVLVELQVRANQKQ